MEQGQKRVIIVGSGIAGLACANELKKNGFSVQILEARHIHGGRISKNTTFADFPIETGAEEIHLPTKYYKIAKEVGAKYQADSDFDSFIEDLGKNGEDIDKGSGILLEDDDFYGKYNLEKIYNSIMKEEEKNLLCDDMSILQYLQNKNIDQRLFQFYEMELATEYGSTLKDISIKGYAEHEQRWEYDDKNFVVTNMSHFDIIERAFASVLPFLKYNTPVNYIAIQTNNQIQNNGVVVMDAFGYEYRADHVVVTVPVSQLKNNSINFIPPLPQEKQKAIQLLQMGQGGKLHMKFKERFWPSNTYSFILRTKIGLIWNCSYLRSKNTFVLCALISGQTSIDMNDPNKRKEMMSELFSKLEQVFKVKKNVEGLLLDYIWTDYNTTKYIEGVYSFPSINLGSYRSVLAQPINNQLFFAGEATDPKYFATMNGALDTGIREAQRIIQLYSFLLSFSLLTQAQSCTENTIIISGKCTCNDGFYGISADQGGLYNKCPSNSNSSTDSNTGATVNVSACNTCSPGFFLGVQAKTNAPQQAATCSTCGFGATTSIVGQVIQTIVNFNACLPGFYMKTLQTGNIPTICSQCPSNSSSLLSIDIGFCKCYDSLAAPLSEQVQSCKCKNGYTGDVATQVNAPSGQMLEQNFKNITCTIH
ncbi:hypothetical protein ABPG72_015272 [Tetrahymena utriculariae]